MALTGERALQIRVDQKLNVTLIPDLIHFLEKLWKAADVYHAVGRLEADLWVLNTIKGVNSHPPACSAPET